MDACMNNAEPTAFRPQTHIRRLFSVFAVSIQVGDF